MNNTSSTKSKSFKATYLRLLNGETPAQSDYWAAKELIDTGHAQGQYQLSRDRDAYGEVVTLLGFAPTMSGRLLADELAEQLRKSSLRHKVKQAAFGLATFGAGWLFGVASQVAANLVTKQLGG